MCQEMLRVVAKIKHMSKCCKDQRKLYVFHLTNLLLCYRIMTKQALARFALQSQ